MEQMTLSEQSPLCTPRACAPPCLFSVQGIAPPCLFKAQGIAPLSLSMVQGDCAPPFVHRARGSYAMIVWARRRLRSGVQARRCRRSAARRAACWSGCGWRSSRCRSTRTSSGGSSCRAKAANMTTQQEAAHLPNTADFGHTGHGADCGCAVRAPQCHTGRAVVVRAILIPTVCCAWTREGGGGAPHRNVTATVKKNARYPECPVCKRKSEQRIRGDDFQALMLAKIRSLEAVVRRLPGTASVFASACARSADK